ncbi:MAG: DUF1320 domain-containing protein [Deltaproteobacteria bacterium]|nr:DUF1320 domain-containing protein [Deltaproteobacteria bacterium]
MAYCTPDDLQKLLPETVLIRLTDDTGAGVIDETRASEAIASSAEEIDAYIGGRVKLPIAGTAPPILGKINVDIAVYNLYSRVKEEIPQTRADRYKNAVRLLEKISKGEISTGLQPPPDPPAAGEYDGAGQVDARTKIFDAATMEKY